MVNLGTIFMLPTFLKHIGTDFCEIRNDPGLIKDLLVPYEEDHKNDHELIEEVEKAFWIKFKIATARFNPPIFKLMDGISGAAFLTYTHHTIFPFLREACIGEGAVGKVYKFDLPVEFQDGKILKLFSDELASVSPVHIPVLYALINYVCMYSIVNGRYSAAKRG